jgi:hypothetical protein
MYTVESQLADLSLSIIPFYRTCHVRPEKAGRMSYSEGLNSVQTILAYIEQQSEAAATDVLLFRHWHDLDAEKRKEAQK